LLAVPLLQELFALVDNAPQEPATDPPNHLSSTTPRTKDEPGKDIPKDDAAKEQQRANEEMHNATLAFEKYGSARFLETFWRFVAMDHPDALALKFIRARKYNAKAAVAMFAACMKWRIESGVEAIFEKGEEGLQQEDGFLHQMTSGKGYLYGTDRQQRPVIYIHVRLHKASEQSQKALEDFVVFQMESLRCLAHGRVDKVTLLFNMTGFGMSNMDWKCLMFIVKCLESYYPESLNVILVHNAPWIFQGIWKVLAPMLDPVVRAKVQFTKSTDDLCAHISPTHLASALGGSNSWQWEYPQIVPGENDLMNDSSARKTLQDERDDLCKQFEEATRKWTSGGSEGQDREMLAKRLRVQYFKLDPYIRGRGAYHRTGNIVGNGLVTFEYPSASDSKAAEYEVIGQEGSRETLELELQDIRGRVAEEKQEA